MNTTLPKTYRQRMFRRFSQGESINSIRYDVVDTNSIEEAIREGINEGWPVRCADEDAEDAEFAEAWAGIAAIIRKAMKGTK